MNRRISVCYHVLTGSYPSGTFSTSPDLGDMLSMEDKFGLVTMKMLHDWSIILEACPWYGISASLPLP